jgi:GAF domain-containing protein
MKNPLDAAHVLTQALHQARTLHRAGRQAEAEAACTAALTQAGLSPQHTLTLLELRSEALFFQARLAEALADGDAMLKLARRERDAVGISRAQSTRANVLKALGRLPEALAASRAALKSAQRGHDHDHRAAQALALLNLCDCHPRGGTGTGVDEARQSLALYTELGDLSGQARATYLLGWAQMLLGQTEDARAHGRQALKWAQAGQNSFEQACALNLLAVVAADLAAEMRLYQEAVDAADLAGSVVGRLTALGNLVLVYAKLGLTRRALREGEDLILTHRQLGMNQQIARLLIDRASTAAEFGELHTARRLLAEYEALLQHYPDPIAGPRLASIRGCVALHEGQPARARAQFAVFVRHTQGVPGAVGFHLVALTLLAEAQLACGQARAALRSSRLAAAAHRAHGLADLSSKNGPQLWWQHHRALLANRRTEEAWAALQQAHALLMEGVKNIRDAGLRRSYLNKAPGNRAITQVWLTEAARRGLPEDKRLAHLLLPSDLGEPFKRLVDSGVRLNQLRSAQELQDFLIEELLELTGAERVLLVLEGAEQTLTLAGAELPRGEDKPGGRAALLSAITPWLNEARLTQSITLRHGPEGAAPVDQRSCLVAPLVAQRQVLGYLYADLEGAFGRFTDIDRDLMAAQAAQAAVALANLRTQEGLERQVQERTAALEQRAAELALINTVQAALAGEMSLQGVYDAVGMKLREVFPDFGVGIRRYDAATGLVHFPFFWSSAERDPPQEPTPLIGFGAEVVRTRRTLLVDRDVATVADRLGSVATISGTKRSKSQLVVPMLAGEQVVGMLELSHHTRERAFSESDVRLLETLAASMSVALENARLFDETQRLLKETEQRNAELAVINAVQQGIAARLDFQSVIDLVGDRLHEMFPQVSVGISLLDRPQQLVRYLYRCNANGEREPETTMALRPNTRCNVPSIGAKPCRRGTCRPCATGDSSMPTAASRLAKRRSWRLASLAAASDWVASRCRLAKTGPSPTPWCVCWRWSPLRWARRWKTPASSTKPSAC